MIDFSKLNISKADTLKILNIMQRAAAIVQSVDGLSLTMDLEIVHNNVGLRLDDLLAADDENFCHDIFGIMAHIDRSTGALKDCFVPRFAKPQDKTEDEIADERPDVDDDASQDTVELTRKDAINRNALNIGRRG